MFYQATFFLFFRLLVGAESKYRERTSERKLSLTERENLVKWRVSNKCGGDKHVSNNLYVAIESGGSVGGIRYKDLLIQQLGGRKINESYKIMSLRWLGSFYIFQ
jgi:hypothetical protein